MFLICYESVRSIAKPLEMPMGVERLSLANVQVRKAHPGRFLWMMECLMGRKT